MKYAILLFAFGIGTIMTALARAQPQPQPQAQLQVEAQVQVQVQDNELSIKNKNIHVFIPVSAGKCELLEVGIQGNANASIDETKYQFIGKNTESDPQIFRCEVEIVNSNFNGTYGFCAISGFNAASTYFFRGESKTLNRSCFVYRLKNGNFYFSATGISSDLCSWTCVSK